MMIQIEGIYNLDLISNFWTRVTIYLSLDTIKEAKLQEKPSLFKQNIQQLKDKLLCGSFGGSVTTGDPNPVPIFAD